MRFRTAVTAGDVAGLVDGELRGSSERMLAGLAAISAAAGATAGVSFDGVDTLTFDSALNGGTGTGDFSFTVTANDDALVEGTETLVATLINPSVVTAPCSPSVENSRRSATTAPRESRSCFSQKRWNLAP